MSDSSGAVDTGSEFPDTGVGTELDASALPLTNLPSPCQALFKTMFLFITNATNIKKMLDKLCLKTQNIFKSMRNLFLN